MIYQLPSLVRYHRVLYKFNAHIGYGHIETAFVLGGESYGGEREVFIIQKRPHNSGRIDIILLGYLNENGIGEGRASQTSHLARGILDININTNFPASEFRYSWKCNYNGMILITRVRVGNGKVYLYQRRREGQSNNSTYRNNVIVLGSIANFESLFIYIMGEILGQPHGIRFIREDAPREEDISNWSNESTEEERSESIRQRIHEERDRRTNE